MRHIDSSIDSIRGIMIVRELKSGVAVCGYDDFNKIGIILPFNVNELKLAEN